MEHRLSLRERKKVRTRDAIVRAAMELFDQNGFDGTTIEEIAAAADVSRRTFFRYFATKEMVMFPHQSAYLAQFRELLLEGDSQEPPFAVVRRACLEMARAYMNAATEHLRQQHIIQRSRSLVARGNELDAEWEEIIAEALTSRLGNGSQAERRARQVAGATLGVIRATLQAWYASACRQNLVELGEEALSLLADGFDHQNVTFDSRPTNPALKKNTAK